MPRERRWPVLTGKWYSCPMPCRGMSWPCGSTSAGRSTSRVRWSKSSSPRRTGWPCGSTSAGRSTSRVRWSKSSSPRRTGWSHSANITRTAGYKDCGGCAWQELPYPLQLKYKQQQVVDQFARIGHLPMDQVEVLPILPSERTTEYRNKLEFTFSDRRWLQSGEDPSTVFDPPVPLDPSEFEGGVFPRHLRGGYSSVNGNLVRQRQSRRIRPRIPHFQGI